MDSKHHNPDPEGVGGELGEQREAAEKLLALIGDSPKMVECTIVSRLDNHS